MTTLVHFSMDTSIREDELVRERRHRYGTYDATCQDLPPHIAALIETSSTDPEDAAWLKAKRVEATCSVLKC